MADLSRNAPLVEETLVSLITSAQHGASLAAFDDLYLLYADRVYRYLLARAGSTEIAEEITAQVFLRLVEKIRLYQIAPKDNVAIFSAWLYRMSHNRLVDHIRRLKRSRAVPLEQGYGMADSRPIIEEVEARIDFERIAEKLEFLSEAQREVILLRFIEGYSIAETAQIMQKNEGAIKALQHRALDNLRQLLVT